MSALTCSTVVKDPSKVTLSKQLSLVTREMGRVFRLHAPRLMDIKTDVSEIFFKMLETQHSDAESSPLHVANISTCWMRFGFHLRATVELILTRMSSYSLLGLIMAVWLLDMDKEYLVEVHGMDRQSFLETLSGNVLVKIFLETLWLFDLVFKQTIITECKRK